MNWKKVCKIIIVFIIFVIIIPLLINYLFKQSTSFDILIAEWSAGDVLSFYGSILGAILTVYGVYLTIQYSQHNYREDVHNRVLPFLALYSLRSRSRFSMFNPVKQEQSSTPETLYEEYRLREIYFIIKNGTVVIKNSLSKEQKQTLLQGGLKYIASEPNTFSLCDVNLISVPLEVENVGNGAAINLRIGLNKMANSTPVYITPINLKQNTIIYLHIFSESTTTNDLGDYKLEFYYDDIFKQQYVQAYTFSIKEENKKMFAELDFDSQQKSIS